MEINDKIVRAYSLGHWIDDRAAKVLRDALRQAVAENLRVNAWFTWLMNNKEGPSPSMMEDWPAEADKLLRGEHD